MNGREADARPQTLIAIGKRDVLPSGETQGFLLTKEKRMAKKSAMPVMPMDAETEELLDGVEGSWETKTITIPNVTLDHSPLKELVVKAYGIFASESYENLDALACRIASVCPKGVNEDNFQAANPVIKSCKAWFRNVEKLRQGLKRPALDWGKAVDTAAAEMVENAEPTLGPLIAQAKTIEDRKKADKAAAEAAAAQKIIDDRLAEEKKHRDMIEAEQAAERKRLEDEKAALEEQAKAMRAEADKLAQERKDAEARNKAANDELAELRKQLEQMGRTEVKGTPEIAKALVDAPDEKMVAIQPIEQRWEPSSPPLFDDEPAPPPPTIEFNSPAIGAFRPTSPPLEDFVQSVHTDVKADADMNMVRQFGNDVYALVYGDAFKKPIHRPACVSPAAKQAVELAVFDLCEIAKRLQEWRGS